MSTPTPGAAPQMAAEQGEWTVMDDHHMSFGDCRLGPQIWMPGRRVGFVETQNCGVMKALECAHHIVHCVNTNTHLTATCADLLAALEAVVKWREGKEGPEYLFEEGCEMMRLVRLALAKAKAGAQ